LPRTASAPPPAPAARVALSSRPNPAHRSAKLEFQLATDESVSLTLYDLQGREVRLLANGSFTAGTHSIPWDGLNANGRPGAAGLYLVRLRGPPPLATEPLVIN